MVGETAKSGGASGDHRILAILLVIILLHKGHCGASVVAAADASIFQDNVTASLNYQGHIIDMDEPHQWFDSEISRMLAPKPPFTPDALKRPTVSNCGRGKKYISCEPLKSQSGSIRETCGSYFKRNC